MRTTILAAIALLGTTAAGPLSRFDAKEPTAVYTTAAKLEDVERCLIDVDWSPPPTVYAQPDRPDLVNMLFFSRDGVTVARAELRKSTSGTTVRIWTMFKQMLSCGPK